MSDQTTWLDPWLHLREMTTSRNDLMTVADRYSRIQRLALEQLNDLRQRSKTTPETLAQLEEIIRFCGDKGQPLWDKLSTLDAKLKEETERLNHD